MRKPAFVMATALAATLMVSVMTTPAAQSADLNVFVVTGVKAGDFLNMRSAAGASHSITGRIPASGQGVVATGEEQKVGDTVWAKVYWSGVGGWVSKRYLLPESAAANNATPPAATPAPANEGGVPPIPEPPGIVVPAPKVPPTTAPPPSATSSGPSLSCLGVAPTWRIDIGESRLSVNMNDGPVYDVPVSFRQTSENNTSIAVIAGADSGNSTQAFMQKVASCTVKGSSRSYPYGVTAVLNNRQVVSGCCQMQ